MGKAAFPMIPVKGQAVKDRKMQQAEASRERKIDPIDLAVALAAVLDRKKADHIEVLDLRSITILADYFVLASGFARIQIQALCDAALEEGRLIKKKCRSVEGYEDSGWILMDYGDVIVHLLTEESRDYYRLERLWGDAPRVDWQTSPLPVHSEEGSK